MQITRLTLLFALAAAQEWNEIWRPQFHQSTPLGWGNDPNGMVFDGTRYHLFYQHYPYDTRWGPMHWGHSSSEDLLTWEHHDVAIKPVGIRDEGPVYVDIDGTQYEVPQEEHPNVGQAFSGSAFLDKEGKFGHGNNAIILIWTEHTEIKEPRVWRRERQSMAWLEASEGYSTVHYWDANAHGIQNDEESNMGYYVGDEAVAGAKHESDIRDPKFVKYDDQTQLAILANCDRMVIYSAPLGTTNQWTPRSAFGVNNGKLDTTVGLSDHDPTCENKGRTDGIWGGFQGGVWECPDLIKMKVEGTETELWVMIVSIGANDGVNDGPNTGSATMYFVGQLNENFQFIPVENFEAYPKWIDHGPDSYAGVTYDNTSPPLFQAWMSNWLYANFVPTGQHGWRSGMTLPRELRLVNMAESETSPDYRLVHEFVYLGSLYDEVERGEFLTFQNTASSAVISKSGVDVTMEFFDIKLNTEGNYTVRFEGSPVVEDPTKPAPPVGDFVETGLYIDADGKQEFRVYRSSNHSWVAEDAGNTYDNDEEEDKELRAAYAHYLKASTARADRVQKSKTDLKIHAVFDVASVEVLFDDGEVSMTSLTFPMTTQTKVTVSGSSGIGNGKYAALKSTVYEHTTTTPYPSTTSPTTTTPAPVTTPPPATTTPPPTCPIVTCPTVTCPVETTCAPCSSGASPLMTAASLALVSAVLYLTV